MLLWVLSTAARYMMVVAEETGAGIRPTGWVGGDAASGEPHMTVWGKKRHLCNRKLCKLQNSPANNVTEKCNSLSESKLIYVPTEFTRGHSLH